MTIAGTGLQSLDQFVAWAFRIGARRLWEATIPRVGEVRMYVLNDRVYILLIYWQGGTVAGWDVFPAIPASTLEGVQDELRQACDLGDIPTSR